MNRTCDDCLSSVHLCLLGCMSRGVIVEPSDTCSWWLPKKHEPLPPRSSPNEARRPVFVGPECFREQGEAIIDACDPHNSCNGD